MSDNPFKVSNASVNSSGGTSFGSSEFTEEELRGIANSQKGLLLSILAYFAAFGLSAASGASEQEDLSIFALVSLLVFLGAMIAGTVFAVMLAVKTFKSMAMGVLFFFLGMVPCLGLVALLAVNSKATKILRAAGYTVGLLGAKEPSQF